MIKIEKVLLFAIVLVLLVGVASATETPQEDQSYTNDDTVVSDISTVSQDNKETIKFEEKNLMDDNPIKIGESKTRFIEKKTKDTNLKKEGIVEVHDYTELQNAVNNASSASADTTIRLLQGSYNNTGTITWNHDGMVLTIDGNGQTINGHQQQVFNIDGASMILKNIIITNATSSYGGAIDNYDGTLTVSNSTFNNNQAGLGGAISNYVGTLTVSNSTFTNNTANYKDGGAIHNYYATLTVSNSTFNNNQATMNGGAIYNDYGLLTITNSQFLNNQAFGGIGGAIYNRGDSPNKLTNIISSNFINNTASNGAAINALRWINLTNNTFKQNTATNNTETIDLNSWLNGIHEDNIYESTDIALNEIKLTIKDDQETFQQDEDIILNYTIQLTNPMYYWDFETGINDITLYINGEKNITTKYENITLKGLKAGKYEIYYTTCNQQSNTVTFKVIGDSQITTPEESYEYYEGINNKIPLHITDPSGEKGTINITIKDQDEYKQLFTYYNIGDGYELPTESLASALKNLYNPLSDSYTINVTYNSDCANPSSTEFTLNITKQRNTTIVFDILNNTKGNVQINITVLDSVYQSPIADASIQITGDINTDTTSGILTDNTLTPGDYTINVEYPETEDYKASQTTIDFTVEIDKDKKIAELEDKIENLTEKLDEAQQTIETLNNNITNLTTQLANTNNELEQATQEIQNLTQQLETAKDQINNLTTQLEEAQKEIQTLNNTIKELTKPPLNTTITVNPIKSSIGSIAKITAIITDKKGNKVNGGKAIFKINGITLKDKNNNVLYAQVKDGQATLNYKVENVWIKSNTYIEAVYSGTENYTSSRTKQTGILNITKGKATITLDPTSITAKAGQTITLRVKVLDANGDRINNDKIIFKLNGITLKDAQANTIYAQVIDGEAKLVYTLPATYSAKTYTLTAVLGGNYYQRTQNNGTLTIEKKTTTINTENVTSKNNQVTIKATITDENQQPLITTTKLAIKANDITINNNTTSNNGTINITFATTLRPGMYELLIISGENGIYNSAKTTTILKI